VPYVKIFLDTCLSWRFFLDVGGTMGRCRWQGSGFEGVQLDPEDESLLIMTQEVFIYIASCLFILKGLQRDVMMRSPYII
jgi:hypothetical protein